MCCKLCKKEGIFTDKKVIIKIICAIVGLSCIAAFLINFLFKNYLFDILSAEWEAGDALSYLASIFGAVGTFSLGYIAYKQNDELLNQNNKLQKIEKDNYIANYSSMILINEIAVVRKAHTAINWDSHSEQIIVDRDVDLNTFGGGIGYQFSISANKLGEAIPSLIHIKSCNMFYGDNADKKLDCYLFGDNYTDTYSRMAIYKDGKIGFNITYVIECEKRERFEEAIKKISNGMLVEIVFNIVTDKNVVTKGKCRSLCKYQNLCGEASWISEKPTVFFYGHELVEEKIKISGENNC